VRDTQAGEYILGIDLGTNSVGWAIVGLVDGEPARLLRAGVRVFDAGMEGDIQSGREESRNLQRRRMRLQRRQTWRRARRMRKVFRLLESFGLLPPLTEAAPPPLAGATGPAAESEKRQGLLNELDRQILASPWFAAKRGSGDFPEPDQTLPYILRAAALDEALERDFLGRALYHLAQRRGFLSNRKQVGKKGDDEGKVKEGIAALREAMAEANARTLGEYLSRLAPSAERIRSRWTARDMYAREFEAIWSAQAKHHPEILTGGRRKTLHRAMFFQRPLWFDPSAVGECELEPGRHRAPAFLLPAQRFRLLQAVNNLRILAPGEGEKPLTAPDRQKLVNGLEGRGDLTFKQVRKLLGLTSEYEFNLERGGEKRLKGNRTNADFRAAFGDRWLSMAPEERDRAVEYVHAFQKPGKLKEAAAKKWRLGEKAAESLSEISLEPDCASLSRPAIEKLLPFLEAGVPYGEARRKVFPESFGARRPLPALPPVSEALPEIRNPAVMRSLTELRKVTNAIVRQYGKPQEIRIELARDLKKSKKQRARITEANRANEEARDEAVQKIKLANLGITEPKRDDILKYRLAEECHWMCPYTGKSISMESLLGPEPQFDIEHIIPFSRSMDNSFQNLTLCYVPENRTVKGNKTPHQAYGGDGQKYEAIRDRVRKFAGERATVAAKLKRFTMDDDGLEIFLEDFRSRQLNDTAYAASLAARYAGLLYGGVIDADGKKRVQTTSGQSTSYFRNLWKLNAVLNDGATTDGGYKPKSRDDHRHHAVDAVVIGLTDAGMIKRLSDAAQRAPLEGRKRFAPLEGPWPNFADAVRAEIGKIVVSHRVSKKVSGALHKDTNYSCRDFGDSERRHRVTLTSLSEKEVMNDSIIGDAPVRRMVREKLVALGGGEPRKVFAAPENLPCFLTADGRRIPVRKVRIQETIKTRKIGDGYRARFVKPGGNHHLEIFGLPSADGKDKRWDSPGVVTMLDAHERLRKRGPVVRRDAEPGWEFRFSIAQGETLAFGDGPLKGQLSVVRAISEEEKTGSVKIEMAPLNDARRKDQIKKSKHWITKSPNELRKWGARKVVVSPLGGVGEAHD
jgi:CRISPR-associated endonuclease Csn1